MHDDPHHSDHSVRDGFFDGSADDIEDLGGGFTHFDDDFPRSRRRSRSGYRDLSGAPAWVKVVVWTGALLAIAGLGVLMLGVLAAPEPISPRLTPAFPTVTLPPGFPTGDLPPGFPADALPPEWQSPGPTGFPSTRQITTPSVGGPNLPLGFGLFFAGFVLTAIGALGHSTSTRR